MSGTRSTQTRTFRPRGSTAAACRDVTFDPLVLPDGIAPSDDPVLLARWGAYAVSLGRRLGEAGE